MSFKKGLNRHWGAGNEVFKLLNMKQSSFILYSPGWFLPETQYLEARTLIGKSCSGDSIIIAPYFKQAKLATLHNALMSLFSVAPSAEGSTEKTLPALASDFLLLAKYS